MGGISWCEPLLDEHAAPATASILPQTWCCGMAFAAKLLLEEAEAIGSWALL
eukprot:CAMPEP_0172919794 /NCGR_PEP_ID=MMETSP1075-20121228/202805_1 /TAXON_ID=2916 /ORGANISM="Ceratium fusus, Strain PA161109" /LENGTH=51 /DNA_ID=CAMNT_0013779693 /DNA_START=153 /DNA_END=305 /DNA_ORIENTATION=-